MMLTTSEGPPILMEKVERLSRVIIESLQELSSANQHVSTATLSRSLARKKEFLNLLIEPVPNKAQAERSSQFEKQAKALDSQIRKAQNRERKLLGQVEELEQRIANILAFQKKSTTALIVLARASTSEQLMASLERFRSLLLNEADLSTLKESFQHIKHMIMKEQDPHGSSGSGNPNPAAPIEIPLATHDATSKEGNDYLPRVQTAFLTILSQFKPVPDITHTRRFLEVEKRVKSCEDMDTLLALGQDLIDIIHDYVGFTSEERNQVAFFVTELGKNLLDMESQLSGSLNDVKKSYQVNKDFTNDLQGQVEDIRASFSFNKTLEEVRSFVLSKIKAIKTALEKKRKQDEVQLQSADQKMSRLQKRLQNMKSEIDQVHQRTKILEQEVQLDSLIGIHNRRAYELRMQEELQRFHRYNHTFSLVMFDVDHFKQVNDQYGHKTGDRCLTEIVNRIRPSLRKSDFLARYGGEEFVIILTGTTKENACKLAEKIRLLIQKTFFACQGQKIPVTISLGVTQVDPNDHEPEDVFARVDAAMYKAKNEGRNRVAAL